MTYDHVMGEHKVHPYEMEFVTGHHPTSGMIVGANLVFAHAANSLPILIN